MKRSMMWAVSVRTSGGGEGGESFRDEVHGAIARGLRYKKRGVWWACLPISLCWS